MAHINAVSTELVDLKSIPGIEFDYATKVFALLSFMKSKKDYVNLLVESKVTVAMLKEMRGAPKQYSDPFQFCVSLLAEEAQFAHDEETNPFWLKPADAFFFVKQFSKASTLDLFCEYFDVKMHQLLTRQQRESKAIFQNSDDYKEARKDRTVIDSVNRLLAFGLDKFSFTTPNAYLYYVESILTPSLKEQLKTIESESEGVATALLKTTDHPFASQFYLDSKYEPYFSLAWENFKESTLTLDDLKNVFLKIADVSTFYPLLMNVWDNGKRGTFARLVCLALANEGESLDATTLEFDKGFCSLLALYMMGSIEEYPEGIQDEFFRMCHYVGFSYPIDRYKFDKPCDYKTHQYCDLPTIVEDTDDYLNYIEFKPSAEIRYRVSYEFNNDHALAYLPLAMEYFGYFDLDDMVADYFESEDFDTYDEAVERAKEFEGERREWILKNFEGNPEAQKELIYCGPRITITPYPVDDDFNEDS